MTHVRSACSPLSRTMALLITAALTFSLAVTFTLTSAKQAVACQIASKLPGKWYSSDDRLSRILVWVSDSCGLYIKAYSTCDHDATKDCVWDKGRSKELFPSKYVAGARYAIYKWNNASEQLLLRPESTGLSVQERIDWSSGATEHFTVHMHR